MAIIASVTSTCNPVSIEIGNFRRCLQELGGAYIEVVLAGREGVKGVSAGPIGEQSMGHASSQLSALGGSLATTGGGFAALGMTSGFGR